MIEINIKFGGFYNTIHSATLEDLSEESEKLDWVGAMNAYSKMYVEFLNKTMDTSIEFVKVLSPKFYNDETDVALCNLSEDDAKKVISYMTEFYGDDMKKNIAYHTTRRDGFIPFFNSQTIWEKKNLPFLIGAVIETLTDDEDFTDEVVAHISDHLCLDSLYIEEEG